MDITQTELWQKVDSETSEMKAKLMDVSEMKNDVKNNNFELAKLRSEVSVMKYDVAELKSFTRQMKAEMNAHFSEVKIILGSLRGR